MNITSLELTQATIEFSLALAFILTAIILKFNSYKKAGMKQFITMFFVISIVLASEGFAYILRGNTSLVFIILNQICNFIVFSFNFLLMSIFIRYVYSIIESNKIKPSKIYLYFVDGAFLLALSILIINIFTGWMYGFTPDNYYYRNYMWYAFTSLAIVLPIACSILIYKNKNVLSKKIYIPIFLYLWLPVIFVIIQTFIYGYAILEIGMSIDLFIMFAFYLVELKNTKMNDEEIKNTKIKKIQSIVIFSILSSFISAAIISCFISINYISKENNKNNGIIYSNVINDKIDYEIQRLVTVSETMSQAYTLKNSLKNSNIINPTNVSEDISNYLSSIKEGFGYNVIYAVSDISKAFYTQNGLNRIISDENDSWYGEFRDSKKNIEVNVDTDKDYLDKVFIFVNVKIYDNSNNYIGVVGAGIYINDIQNIIIRFEETYQAEVSIVDKNGLVLISNDKNYLNNYYLDNSYFNEVNSNSFYYNNNYNDYTLAKYLELFDAYLVIKYVNLSTNSLYNMILPSIIIYLIGLLLLGFFFLINYIEDKRVYDAIIEKKKLAITDEMTGLLNRSTYEQDIQALSLEDLSGYSIVQFDINGLKATNDTIGHIAGDEMLINAAHFMSNIFCKYGKCYRIGGDEFIAIIKCSRDLIENNLKTFNYLCTNFKGKYINNISVSIGYACYDEHKDMSLADLIIVADDLMYDSKNEYYKKTRKRRRD